MFGDWTKQISETGQVFLVFTATLLIDAVYILIAVFVNVGVDQLIGLVKLTGLTYWTITITQVLLALASLFAVAMYVYSDMRIIFIRVQKLIAKEQVNARSIAPLSNTPDGDPE